MLSVRDFATDPHNIFKAHEYVGLIDGAIVVIDLVLGIEKHFLEKHPGQITSLAFYEDKSLISGSVDGRVNIADIENMDRN